jgi:membrane-associated phospholipid phosphatase
MKTTAQVISVLFHPLLMPTLIFGVLFYIAPSAIPNLDTMNGRAAVTLGESHFSIKDGLLMLLFMYTFVVPALCIYYFKRLGWVQSLTLDTLTDRRLPYLASVAIYTLATVFCYLKLKQLPQIALILGSITLAIALVAFISLYWKISAHAVGIAGALGAFVGIFLRYGEYNLFYPIVLTIILAGAVLSARLYLNAHTPPQVLSGFVLGFGVSLLTVIVLG